MAGPEFGTGSSFSNANPGVHGTAYMYDSQESFNYVASRGYDIVRLPFRWERLQPVLGQPLDAQELARLQAAVSRIKNAGMTTVLDLHNYGEYMRDVNGVPTRHTLGSAELPHSYFVDVWQRISAAFKGNPGVEAYGLMNEPHDIANAHGSPAKNWEVASQAAVTAIRNNADTTKISVAGYGWSGVTVWTSLHPTPWITDPAQNMMYEAHHYWDRDTSGDYPDSYKSEVDFAHSLGYFGTNPQAFVDEGSEQNPPPVIADTSGTTPDGGTPVNPNAVGLPEDSNGGEVSDISSEQSRSTSEPSSQSTSSGNPPERNSLPVTLSQIYGKQSTQNDIIRGSAALLAAVTLLGLAYYVATELLIHAKVVSIRLPQERLKA